MDTEQPNSRKCNLKNSVCTFFPCLSFQKAQQEVRYSKISPNKVKIQHLIAINEPGIPISTLKLYDFVFQRISHTTIKTLTQSQSQPWIFQSVIE